METRVAFGSASESGGNSSVRRELDDQQTKFLTRQFAATLSYMDLEAARDEAFASYNEDRLRCEVFQDELNLRDLRLSRIGRKL